MMQTYENIKFFRELRGLSQEELAHMVGYKDRSSIAKIETGNVDLGQSKIAAFAEALSVSPARLMGIETAYSTEELIDLYMRGAIKWSADFRFSEEQRCRLIEYLADAAFKLKQTVNMMAESKQQDGKILLSPALHSAIDEMSHWSTIALDYVNDDLKNEISTVNTPESAQLYLSKSKLSIDENSLITKYRQLDDYGKDTVNFIADRELLRLERSSSNETNNLLAASPMLIPGVDGTIEIGFPDSDPKNDT